MTDPTGPFYVAGLVPGISANAAIRGNSPYVVKERVPMEFDFDAPSCRRVNTYRRQRPTVFRCTEEELRGRIEHFLARVRAILRTNQATGTHVAVGDAHLLVGKDYGAGIIGGYEILPLAALEAEWAEDDRLRVAHEHDRLAHAERQAADAAAQVERIREEVEAAELVAQSAPSVAATKPSGPTSEWTATPDHPGIQWRKRATDGATVYRGRRGGETSEAFTDLEQARQWVRPDEADWKAELRVLADGEIRERVLGA